MPDDVLARGKVNLPSNKNEFASRRNKVLIDGINLAFNRYICRSVEFDDKTKQCILSEEDSISQKDDLSISSSPTHHFYDLVCLDNRKSIFDALIRA